MAKEVVEIASRMEVSWEVCVTAFRGDLLVWLCDSEPQPTAWEQSHQGVLRLQNGCSSSSLDTFLS